MNEEGFKPNNVLAKTGHWIARLGNRDTFCTLCKPDHTHRDLAPPARPRQAKAALTLGPFEVEKPHLSQWNLSSASRTIDPASWAASGLPRSTMRI